MTTKEKIEQAITFFVKGGDNSDTQLLNTVLHHDFRVTSNNFLGEPGVAILNKVQYIANIEKGIFGGLPRKMEIMMLDESDTIAMVKIRLESAQNNFVSYNSMVLDTDNEWKLINNHVVVEAKKV
ncbi:MAG TPA: nuclear transport factor 2 family protein [Flavobacterium sp.]|nr:nuclear transport factor 2 family protein [Flavobacterium sp.]